MAKIKLMGTSPPVQWLTLLAASHARSTGSVPVQGTKIHKLYSAVKKTKVITSNAGEDAETGSSQTLLVGM